MVLSEDKDHFSLFEKPKIVEKCSTDSGLYQKYISSPRSLDYVVEYFKFEAKLKAGFTSPYLRTNPYEGEFADFVQFLEKKYSYLPKTEADVHIYGEIETKYRLAIGSSL